MYPVVMCERFWFLRLWSVKVRLLEVALGSGVPLVLDKASLEIGLQQRWEGLREAGGEFHHGRGERRAGGRIVCDRSGCGGQGGTEEAKWEVHFVGFSKLLNLR